MSERPTRRRLRNYAVEGGRLGCSTNQGDCVTLGPMELAAWLAQLAAAPQHPPGLPTLISPPMGHWKRGGAMQAVGAHPTFVIHWPAAVSPLVPSPAAVLSLVTQVVDEPFWNKHKPN